MDYSEVCQGWIYCITNKVNGKKYIGQTIDFKRRKKEHFTTTATWCPLLKAAIHKYGEDNFIMKSVVMFTAINREVCVDILNKLEVFYIKKYHSHKSEYGYNISEGGGGNLGFRHTEETKKRISDMKKGKKMSEEFREKCRNNSRVENLGDCRKAVLLYDLNGIFRREYPGINDAIRALGKKVSSCKSSVLDCLKDAAKQIYGYQWRYKTTDKFPFFIEPYADKRAKLTYHYSLEGELLGAYSSAYAAAKETGISYSTISNSLVSETKGRLRKKDYWSHKAPSV